MSVVEITNYNQHESFINDNANAVIFFGSERCHHCVAITPVVKQLAGKYPNVKFGHVEVTKAKVQNINKGVPVFVGYRNHQPVDVVLGADEEGLVDLIESL